MKKVTSATELAFKLMQEINEKVIPNTVHKIALHKIDFDQLKIQAAPILSNAIFHRENTIIEAERFRTLVYLSRSFDDAEMEIVIEALQYKISIIKKQ